MPGYNEQSPPFCHCKWLNFTAILVTITGNMTILCSNPRYTSRQTYAFVQVLWLLDK